MAPTSRRFDWRKSLKRPSNLLVIPLGILWIFTAGAAPRIEPPPQLVVSAPAPVVEVEAKLDAVVDAGVPVAGSPPSAPPNEVESH